MASSFGKKPPVNEKVETVLAKVTPALAKELNAKGFRLGAPIFIRIFKLSAQLEVWLDRNGRYELFRSYPVCDFSGYPGPKLHEGDWQSPEGFYTVSADQMNPRSSFHLSFNIGYPNEYDTYRNRSGSNIMVHGSCSSMGCFAMNDYRMEEIYTLAHAALSNGQQSFAVHIFPFRMTADNMDKFRSSPWIGFWQNLKEGHDAFALSGQVPAIQVVGGRYVVTGTVKMAMRNGEN
ncbi:MAG: murein L,D-transpeptidase [Desulfobulbaceae bacterium]|nr:murein L,D-transpeptidase [Desulfobulbaceae bacterium]